MHGAAGGPYSPAFDPPAKPAAGNEAIGQPTWFVQGAPLRQVRYHVDKVHLQGPLEAAGVQAAAAGATAV